MNITIIGSGNIGSALVNGLLQTPSIRPADITLTDINVDALNAFAVKGVTTTQNNAEAVRTADIVVLCVKPYLVKDVIAGFLPSLAAKTLLVSFAAGVPLEQLKQYAGNRALFRVIPNTAMAVNQSMTCIATDGATPEQDKTVLDFFSLVGKAVKIDESLMNAATVVASCGTAFALRYLRAATTAGVELGFRPTVAMNMIAQTMAGAAALIEASGKHPEEEIDKVTTPKGITIKGLNELEHAGFSSAVMKGILAAYNVF
ncbi:MAG: pyrroline-5-carboxylate reductase [Bacteroidales bacterium]|jgi:pyrroline-5-carboxylate reductase|nr:pyrroline-5-carboxylate reductase [Bacteroidales bacterium]